MVGACERFEMIGCMNQRIDGNTGKLVIYKRKRRNVKNSCGATFKVFVEPEAYCYGRNLFE
jgi:hypothetical protein